LYACTYARVISRLRNFSPFVRSAVRNATIRRRDETMMIPLRRLGVRKRSSWESDWLNDMLNNVINAITEIRNLLNFLKSACVSLAFNLYEMTEANSYKTLLPKQLLSVSCSVCLILNTKTEKMNQFLLFIYTVTFIHTFHIIVEKYIGFVSIILICQSTG